MAPDSRPASPGTPVVDGVADLELIGRGGFARVYRGWQAEMRRHVAVKVLEGVVEDPDANRRFRREVAAMGAASHHPNVVPVFVTGVTIDGHPYLIMPFYPGGNLNERLREGPLDPTEVVGIGAKVAAALAAAHDTGVLHRDVKPSNILFSAFGEPLLADFGIARLSDSTLTNANVVAATIAYAAPESLSGQPVGPVADVYSLGATLYAALAGAPPFVIGPDETLAAFVARAVTQPPADLRPTVPDPLAAAIERAMAKDPGRRTATANQLERDLAACKDGGATVAFSPAAGDAPRADPPVLTSPYEAEAAKGPTPVVAAAALGRPPARIRDEMAATGPSTRTNRRRQAAMALAAVAALLAIVVVAYTTHTSGQHRAVPSPSSAPPPGLASTVPSASTTTSTSPTTTTTTVVPPRATSPATVRAVVPVVPSSPPSTAQATTTSTSPSPTSRTGPAPGAPTIAGTVTDYYRLLSDGDVKDGFQRLTPAYQQQAGGFGGYSAFWARIRRVDVSNVNASGTNGATATLHYVTTDGTDSVEQVELRFVRDPRTGNFLIDAYGPLGSLSG